MLKSLFLSLRSEPLECQHQHRFFCACGKQLAAQAGLAARSECCLSATIAALALN